MTSYSRAERTALCDLLEELGPDAPTMCEGWTTHDLVAHLFIRERRPLAAPAIQLAPLSELVERSMIAARDRHDFQGLVAAVRGGPPLWSVFRYVDEQLNLLEYFVHLEDVRRAQPGWEPRELTSEHQDALWGRLKPFLRLKSGTGSAGILLQRDTNGDVLRLQPGEPTITMVGPASELVLYAFGRTSVARVDEHTDPDPVADLGDAARGN